MKRPNNVPPDWILGTCTHCGQRVWYPPDAEQAALARGVAFMPVCSTDCALLACKRFEPTK